MFKYLIPALALLWGLASLAFAQGMPPLSEGMACIVTSPTPSPTLGNYAIVNCDPLGGLRVSGAATTSFSVAKTTGIGTTGVQVSPTDNVNRRTVTNTGTNACEIMPNAGAFGAGHPLPAGTSFSFDSAGRTTAAIFIACASAGGSISVISY